MPTTGKPNSTDPLYNPDGTIRQERTYGPDGRAKKDTDYYGHPELGPSHKHEWDWDKVPPRQPAKPSTSAILAAGAAFFCVVGIIWVVANDVTGIGIADDGLLGPLGAGLTGSISMLY